VGGAPAVADGEPTLPGAQRPGQIGEGVLHVVDGDGEQAGVDVVGVAVSAATGPAINSAEVALRDGQGGWDARSGEEGSQLMGSPRRLAEREEFGWCAARC
jgi:hypothetical protein